MSIRSWRNLGQVPVRRRLERLCLGLVLAGLSAPAVSANAALQDYFSLACQSATGALATRCSATPGGLGGLSGDSQSSLNPSQNMSHTNSSASLAEVRSSDARERATVVREGEAPAADTGQTLHLGPFNLLLNARATWFARDRNPAVNRERGLDGDSWAVELGVDRRVSERLNFGALGVFESVRYDFDADRSSGTLVPAAHAGSAQTDSRSLTLFAVFNATERSYVDAALGYGRQQHEFHRNPVFQNSLQQGQFSARLVGEPHSEVYWIAVDGGLDFASGATTFGPFAGLTYTHSKIAGYAEHDLNGSGLNMVFAPCLRISALAHAGVRADRAFSTAHGVFVPQLRVEYLHEFRTQPLSQTSHYVLESSGAGITVTGDRHKADRISLSAGLSAIFPHGSIAFLNLDTLVGGDLDRTRLALGVRIEL